LFLSYRRLLAGNNAVIPSDSSRESHGDQELSRADKVARDLLFVSVFKSRTMQFAAL
jgi:hypothetical protein